MKKLILFSLTVIVPVLLSAACELKDPCDPGQEFKYGVCIIPDPPPKGAGGEPGCEMAPGGAGGEDECIEAPNVGDECTEGGDECVGETVCGAPQLAQCVALCGPGDPFEDGCPNDLTCTDFGEASVCF